MAKCLKCIHWRACFNGKDWDAAVETSCEYFNALPIVYCKECKHLEFSDFYGECGKGILGIVKPWDFCSRGEREDRDI